MDNKKFKITNLKEGVLIYRTTYSVSWFEFEVNYNNSLFTVHMTESECKTDNKVFINKTDKTGYNVKKDGKNIITNFISNLPKDDKNRKKVEQFRDEIVDFCINYIEQKKIIDQKNEEQRDREFSESIIKLL